MLKVKKTLWSVVAMGAMAAFAASPEMRKAARHMAGYDYSDEERRQLIEPVAAGVLRVEPLSRTVNLPD